MRNLNGESALWRAAWGGHDDVVARLLQRDDIDVNDADEHLEATPLALAVRNGNTGVVRLLLAMEGTDVNSEDLRGRTPVFNALSLAIETFEPDILMMILAREDADLTHRNIRGWTPLIYAVMCKERGLTQILMSHSTSSTRVPRSKRSNSPLACCTTMKRRYYPASVGKGGRYCCPRYIWGSPAPSGHSDRKAVLNEAVVELPREAVCLRFEYCRYRGATPGSGSLSGKR